MVGDGEMEERESVWHGMQREMWMRGVDLRERRTVGEERTRIFFVELVIDE